MLTYIVCYLVGYVVGFISIFLSNKYTSGKNLPVLDLNKALLVSLLSWILVAFHVGMYLIQYIPNFLPKIEAFLKSIDFRKRWNQLDKWFQDSSIFRESRFKKSNEDSNTKKSNENQGTSEQ